MEKANFSSPTKTVDLSGMGTVDVLAMGDMTVNRMTFQPGWRWSEHARPVVGGTSCQTFHHGFVTSGHLVARMDDGTEEEFRAATSGSSRPATMPGSSAMSPWSRSSSRRPSRDSAPDR